MSCSGTGAQRFECTNRLRGAFGHPNTEMLKLPYLEAKSKRQTQKAIPESEVVQDNIRRWLIESLTLQGCPSRKIGNRPSFGLLYVPPSTEKKRSTLWL